MADDPVDDDTFATVIRCAPLVSIDLVLRDPAGRVLVGCRNNEPARGMLFVPGSVIR
jgi:colanic acid biosynthesis protein WcaH